MDAGLLGLFSGFPTHHFTDEIAKVLCNNLPKRSRLVFISAWPEDYARNDDDRDGMRQLPTNEFAGLHLPGGTNGSRLPL